MEIIEALQKCDMKSGFKVAFGERRDTVIPTTYYAIQKPNGDIKVKENRGKIIWAGKFRPAGVRWFSGVIRNMRIMKVVSEYSC